MDNNDNQEQVEINKPDDSATGVNNYSNPLAQPEQPQKKSASSKVYLIIGYLIAIFSFFMYLLTKDPYAFYLIGLSVFILLIGVTKNKSMIAGSVQTLSPVQTKDMKKGLIIGFTVSTLIMIGIVLIAVKESNKNNRDTSNNTNLITTKSNENSIDSEKVSESEDLTSWGLTGELPFLILESDIVITNEVLTLNSKQFTKQLKNIGCGFYCGEETLDYSNTGHSIILVNREKAPTDVAGEPLAEPYPKAIRKIGDYYYRISYPGSPPSDPTPKELEAMELQTSYSNAAEEFFNSLRLIEDDDYVYIPGWDVYIGVNKYADKIEISGPSGFYDEGNKSDISIIVKPEFDFYLDCKTSIAITRVKDTSEFNGPPIGEYYYYNSGDSECGGANLSSNVDTVSSVDLRSAFSLLGVRK